METLKVVAILGGSGVTFLGFILALFLFLVKSEERDKKKVSAFVLAAIRQLFGEAGELASFSKTVVVASEGNQPHVFYRVWIVFEVSRASDSPGGFGRYSRAVIFYSNANSSRDVQLSAYFSEALKAIGWEVTLGFSEKQPTRESFRVHRVGPL